jgi:hypothetical protein
MTRYCSRIDLICHLIVRFKIEKKKINAFEIYNCNLMRKKIVKQSTIVYFLLVRFFFAYYLLLNKTTTNCLSYFKCVVLKIILIKYNVTFKYDICGYCIFL